MSMATVIPVLYYNLIHPLKIMSYNSEIISSFFVWFLVGAGLFYYLPHGLYFKIFYTIYKCLKYLKFSIHIKNIIGLCFIS